MVGVGAYLGGALLITDKSVLTTGAQQDLYVARDLPLILKGETAAQILTIEARHSSLLNTFNSGSFQAQRESDQAHFAISELIRLFTRLHSV